MANIGKVQNSIDILWIWNIIKRKSTLQTFKNVII